MTTIGPTRWQRRTARPDGTAAPVPNGRGPEDPAAVDAPPDVAASARKSLPSARGAERTGAVGARGAYASRRPELSVLAFAAHSDLRDEYPDSRYNHACTLRRASESAPVTLVGLRSASAEEATLIRDEHLAFLS